MGAAESSAAAGRGRADHLSSSFPLASRVMSVTSSQFDCWNDAKLALSCTPSTHAPDMLQRAQAEQARTAAHLLPNAEAEPAHSFMLLLQVLPQLVQTLAPLHTDAILRMDPSATKMISSPLVVLVVQGLWVQA